ncbi:multiple inositol polyphosphate phosphatase 1-like isoform X1 [Bradysia coprophila]|uniref:multiple inositol polyphosphate phosphatase 1-like isoform X1 n=1 Tax=Bradysia coprophila TaxID=38358 RepID=UPI00187DD2FA|nr:multiple inositol polyphosphate phosphatase 1-like isoform X1 [Bradysia coprophila]
MKVNLAVVVATFVACTNATLLVHDPEYCYSTDPIRSQLKMFSTTTPYDTVRGSAYNPSTCTPKRFWLVSRHGSRYPSIADRDQLLSPNDPIQSKIMENYDSGKTTLCRRDAQKIREWHLDPTFVQTAGPANLSVTGWNEIKNIARRYQTIFPGLLPRSYSQSHYFFRNSPYLRTRQTAQAFAEGLFGPDVYQRVNYTGGSWPDLFMFPFGTCPAWMELISSGSIEAQAFADGPRFQEMITQVSNKLGFVGSDRLNQTQVVALMTHCQYEQILNHLKASPFCSAFSPGNVQVYEYYNDLIFYYMCGYGYTSCRTMFKNMDCYLVQDMLDFLQAADNQRAKLSFGHDTTVQFLMVAMGLFNDRIPLTAKNFEKQLSRHWRTSLITPMAANLAVVRYDCRHDEDEVLFELNEKPLLFPGCDSNGVCKISVVLNRLSHFAKANCASLYCKN